MKTLRLILMTLFTITIFLACEFDNFEAPEVTLTGHLKYNGENLDTRQNVLFELYQYKEDGYAAAGSKSIDVRVDQEGKYSAVLFPGRYKMVVNALNGGLSNIYDWTDFPKNEAGNLDTLYFTLNGSKTMDFNIMPYYKINNFQAFYRNDSIISNFTIQKLTDITSDNVKFRSVFMYLSPTIHVNNDTELSFPKTASSVTVDTPIEIKGSLTNYYTNTYYKNNFRNYVYVRIAISLRVSSQDFIFSKIIKVDGIPQETINKFK